MLPADLVRPVEDRAEVLPLGDLHARRRLLLVSLAPLKALHGHNGIWDDRRKAYLEAMKVKARQALTDAGQKTTEGMIDALAYGDEMYARFIDDGIAARIAYITAQNELDEIAELIRDRELCLLVFNSEVKLAR